METIIEALARDIQELPRKPDKVNATEEAEYLHRLLSDNPAIVERLSQYSEPKIVGVGGSGIILRSRHLPSEGDRALKFPRKSVYEHAASDPKAVEPDPERTALEKISHQNITRLYDAFELPNGVSHCMIGHSGIDTNPLTLDLQN